MEQNAILDEFLEISQTNDNQINVEGTTRTCSQEQNYLI